MVRADRKPDRRALEHFAERGKAILRRHDPLGLIEMGAPGDEYDGVLSGVLIELSHHRGATLAAWMERYFADQFGTSPDAAATTAAAGDLVALWSDDDLAPLRR